VREEATALTLELSCARGEEKEADGNCQAQSGEGISESGSGNGILTSFIPADLLERILRARSSL
jgi:hypothetical protein